MNLDRSKRLLATEQEFADPMALLVEILAVAVELLSLDENDFAWSPWNSKAEALAEVEALLAVAKSGVLPDHAKLWVLFAPTGPLQEVSVSSGWGKVFIKLAERFDQAEDRLWPPPDAVKHGR